jgi:hypothetical protein
MDKIDLRTKCLELLQIFIKDASNENKMELHLIYDEISDEEKVNALGNQLNEVFSKIILENYHPDEYLELLKTIFF